MACAGDNEFRITRPQVHSPSVSAAGRLSTLAWQPRGTARAGQLGDTLARLAGTRRASPKQADDRHLHRCIPRCRHPSSATLRGGWYQ